MEESNFIVENWQPLALAALGFIKVIVNLTPSKKDNQIFGFVDKLFNFIVPNLKKGGGSHDKNILVKKK